MLGKKLSQQGHETLCPITVLMKDSSILVGRRHYQSSDGWKNISVWTIPGGRCDPKETVEQTLRREVKEEVGIDIFNIVDLIGEVSGAKEGDIVPIFFSTTTQDAQLMEPEKFSEWKWIPEHEYLADENYSGFNPEARAIIVEYLKKRKG